MSTMKANEAKVHFGNLLLKAQSELVEIERHGKVVAVVMSKEAYDLLENLKMENLKKRVESAKAQAKAGTTMDGNTFFDKVLYSK